MSNSNKMTKETETYVPVGQYRGALTKEEALANLDDDELEESEIDPLSLIPSKKKRKKKGTQKTHHHSHKKSLKKSTSNTSLSISDDLNEPASASKKHRETISIDDDDLFSVPTPNTSIDTVLSNVPELQNALQQIRRSQELRSSLSSTLSSASRATPNIYTIDSDGEDEYEGPKKLDIGARIKGGQTFKFKIFSNQPLSIIADAISKTVNVSPSLVTLKFDGIEVKTTKTPANCNMQSGDYLDVIINKPVVASNNNNETLKKTLSNTSSLPINNKSQQQSINLDDDDEEDDHQDYHEEKDTSKDYSENIPEDTSFDNNGDNDDDFQPRLTKPIGTLNASALLKNITEVEQKLEKASSTGTSSAATVVDEDAIKLKVRLGTDVFKFKISKEGELQKLFEGFCAKAKVDINKVKFMFDGMILKPKQTPEDLDMEDDDLIDASIKP